MFLMSHNIITLKKDNLDNILKILATKYSQINTTPICVYIVGGSAIVLNFDYRESTLDIDAFYESNTAFEKAAKETGEEFELTGDWINQDFINTPSFTPKIIDVSKLYKRYRNVSFYTVKPEFLIAMKLKSARPTGGDLDDVIKMIYELRLKGKKITYKKIINAFEYLYDEDYSNTISYFFRKMEEAFYVDLKEIELLLKKYRF